MRLRPDGRSEPKVGPKGAHDAASARGNGLISLIEFIYHEAHEDHEVFFNLTSLCVLRALRSVYL